MINICCDKIDEEKITIAIKHSRHEHYYEY